MTSQTPLIDVDLATTEPLKAAQIRALSSYFDTLSDGVKDDLKMYNIRSASDAWHVLSSAPGSPAYRALESVSNDQFESTQDLVTEAFGDRFFDASQINKLELSSRAMLRAAAMTYLEAQQRGEVPIPDSYTIGRIRAELRSKLVN